MWSASGAFSPANDQARPRTSDRAGPDALQNLLAGGGETVDQAGDGRLGGDRAEYGRLTPQHRDVREAVAAVCDRQSDVQEGLAEARG